jgi:streptomycin 6-kinase
MLEQVPQAVTALADPADRQLLRGWASAVAGLVGEPGHRMLHWDLHYDNVLAAERELWLAISRAARQGSGIPASTVGRPGQPVGRRVAQGNTLRVV